MTIRNALPSSVIVHPLVLLSVVDHYHRVIGISNVSAASHDATAKRVVGVLLGQWVDGGSAVNVSNSYAVPFEEEEKNPGVWFLDHNYHENMFELFKKVTAKERVVGWYHTGPKLRSSDIAINELFKKYIPNPVLVVIDVQLKESKGSDSIGSGLPTEAYIAVEEVHENGLASDWTFNHVSSAIEAEEAEEVGVEHLLRDIRDHSLALSSVKPAMGEHTTSLVNKLVSESVPLNRYLVNSQNALASFHQQLEKIQQYLLKVSRGECPMNLSIMAIMQDIFNLQALIAQAETDGTPSTDALPSTATTAKADSWKWAEGIKANDHLGCVYLGALSRAMIALHNLIDNKIMNSAADVEP